MNIKQKITMYSKDDNTSLIIMATFLLHDLISNYGNIIFGFVYTIFMIYSLKNIKYINTWYHITYKKGKGANQKNKQNTWYILVCN